VSIQRLSNRSIEFDLIGVDASVANALRRILIAEVRRKFSISAWPSEIRPGFKDQLETMQVPTICVENVYVWNNTTMIADEVLAHRIGLVPLNVDPSTLLMKSSASLAMCG
jgi:DNA-directed RNA polymerases I and III subunit RPAC1